MLFGELYYVGGPDDRFKYDEVYYVDKPLLDVVYLYNIAGKQVGRVRSSLFNDLFFTKKQRRDNIIDEILNTN